jgi:hypothetical protein
VVSAWIRALWSGLKTYDKQIASLAAIATTCGIVFAALQLRQTSQSLEASTVYQVQKDGRDLFRLLREDKQVLDYIYNFKASASYDAKIVSRAELTITELVQYFSSVFNQHRNGVITDAYWDSFAGEICAFIGLPPVSKFWEQKVMKGKYSKEFKTFGKECSK